jgi:hypothetical protein
MRTRAVAPLLSLVVLACSDAPSQPDIAEGTTAFAYSGAIAGTFGGTGVRNDASHIWHYASRHDSIDVVIVNAGQPNGSERADYLTLWISRLTPGTVVVDAAAAIEYGASIVMRFGQSTSDGPPSFLWSCVAENGTITIDAISESRVSGTFSGTGTCTDMSGASSPFSMTGGTFDVPFSTHLGLD